MSGYKIQLKDKNGNKQYPVSTTDVVVNADGVSVADLLDRKQPTLVSGVNIKTINGKTLLGSGDIVIEGGNGEGSEDSDGGSFGDNVITLYVPVVDDITDKVVTYDEALVEIENNFGEDDVEIPQLVKDALIAFFVSMKQHNAAEYARAKKMAEDGEEVSIMLKGYEYPLLALALYLLDISLGNGSTVTPEEFVEQFNAMTSVDDMIFPKGYATGYSVDGVFGMEVTYERYVLAPNEDGEWAISAIRDARRTATLYYEGDARLDADRCENNLHVKDFYLNDCDFDVLEYIGNNTSTHHDVLIIGKSTKTVTDFVDLDGTVSTRTVVVFRYIEDMNMVELQVSTYDGYCRRVVLGKVNVGENGGGSSSSDDSYPLYLPMSDDEVLTSAQLAANKAAYDAIMSSGAQPVLYFADGGKSMTAFMSEGDPFNGKAELVGMFPLDMTETGAMVMAGLKVELMSDGTMQNLTVCMYGISSLVDNSLGLIQDVTFFLPLVEGAALPAEQQAYNANSVKAATTYGCRAWVTYNGLFSAPATIAMIDSDEGVLLQVLSAPIPNSGATDLSVKASCYAIYLDGSVQKQA